MYAGLTTADKPILEKAMIGWTGGKVYLKSVCDWVEIPIALAQIAEMEKNQVISEIVDSIENKPPLTWNERINQMTVEERDYWSPSFAYIQERSRKWATKKFKYEPWKQSDAMSEYMRKFLHSPYTEGEK